MPYIALLRHKNFFSKTFEICMARKVLLRKKIEKISVVQKIEKKKIFVVNCSRLL